MTLDQIHEQINNFKLMNNTLALLCNEYVTNNGSISPAMTHIAEHMRSIEDQMSCVFNLLIDIINQTEKEKNAHFN